MIFKAKKSLGQNFLVDQNILMLIANSTKIEKSDENFTENEQNHGFCMGKRIKMYTALRVFIQDDYVIII